ncbi:hypothetical protein Lal_00000097 [Lupinus albus]|uniref:Putative BAH domain, Agenet-like domain, Agenet domain, plant type n=1 Tax=Lupinus albus TaxID=3870 RepID=A0A6A5LE26_LUPAL|nr:putative BAH domain, Agenet-like domain, Agenet domain, plant type [Lupinus albus]KAF1860684.1 hypothetical protein Lal_00000097 [Lupinus albus]
MASLTASFQYMSWEEVLVSNEKRRRVVHYFLKKRDESLDLAVVAKEKNFRHFSYHCVLSSIASSFTLFNPKSRRDLVLWLDSLVSDWPAEDVSHAAEAAALKDDQLRKLGHDTKEFLWLGSPWTCRKRRKHYQSFQKNGFKISVYDFVCVLAEDKNLVAYLEDMYEDSGGNKMVVVRWFYKIHDVGIVLPGSFCDREVFFSRYLQDLSIECVDGFATVLNPQHYERFQNEARHTRLEPFICGNQFDNNDLKPFDITQLRGYWKQEIIRYMYTFFDSKSNGSSGQSDDSQESLQHNASVRYKKRLHSVKIDHKDVLDIAADKLQYLSNTRIDTKAGVVNNSSVTVAPNNLVVGSQVEVLSQDSGIRGCWFRASVIKKHKNKVKVLYQNIPDAVDETKKLEEWVLASKILVHDELSLRMYGRTRIRPASPSPKFEMLLGVDVGSIVDAWWHDGWWEGIIIHRESEANYHVYFPGEKLVSVFDLDNLRCSLEWTGNEWVNVRGRPDLVTSLLSSLKTKQDPCKSHDRKSTISSIVDVIQSKQGDTCLDSEREKPRKHEVFPDLLNDGLLSQLRWKSSRKRRRGNGSYCGKLQCKDNEKNASPNTPESHASDRFIIPASFQVEHDMVMPSLTNMVVCR